jgi:hypothetical protein
MFAFAKLCNDNIEGKNKFKSNGKDNFNIQHSLLIIQYSKTPATPLKSPQGDNSYQEL